MSKSIIQIAICAEECGGPVTLMKRLGTASGEGQDKETG